jgi:transposase
MSSKVPYRRHSPEFKLQLCREIRAGALGRLEAQRKYKLSSALVHSWLTQFDRGDMEPGALQSGDSVVVAEYEAKIAELERKVGQLTMELDLVKKIQRLRPASGSETSSIVSGPRVAPSGADAK